MAVKKLYADRGFLHTLQGGKIPHESERSQGIIKSGISTARIGMFLSRNGESEPDLSLAVATDGAHWEYFYDVLNMAALLRVDPNWTIDDALPDEELRVQTFKRGCGAVVPCFLQALGGPIAIQEGDRMELATNGGMIALYAYGDGAVATDTLDEIVGQAAEASVGSTSDDLILLVRLS